MHERGTDKLAEYLNRNKEILIFNVETKDKLPVSEMGKVLQFSKYEEYDELADRMCNLIDAPSKLDEEIEKFLKNYNL